MSGAMMFFSSQYEPDCSAVARLVQLKTYISPNLSEVFPNSDSLGLFV